MHSDEQRIMTADSTESLIRFCKEIGPAIAIAGKINRRHSSNWPVTSGCSRYFTGDFLVRLAADLNSNEPRELSAPRLLHYKKYVLSR